MIAAIHQPNYLPWLGYFDKMAKADVFVIFDDVQLPMGGHHYETRAVIKGPTELNIPVLDRGKYLIRDTHLAPGRWREKHLKSISLAYRQSSKLGQLAEIYRQGWPLLSGFNVALIRLVADWLRIKARIVLSSDLGVEGQGTEKILGIIKAVGADTYVSGTGAGSHRYVNEDVFRTRGINVIWHEFKGPNLSVIDSLLKCCANN